MAYSRIVRDLEYQDVPELEANEYVCRNLSPLGNLLFELQILPNSFEVTAQLPQKFEKRILFGRGDLCICTINDPQSDEIGRIDMLLTKINAKDLIKRGVLPPSEFTEEPSADLPAMAWESSDSYY